MRHGIPACKPPEIGSRRRHVESERRRKHAMAHWLLKRYAMAKRRLASVRSHLYAGKAASRFSYIRWR